MRITLSHSSGIAKRVKIGFSWTFLFFGLWVPLFRGDFRNFFRIWGLAIITLGIYAIISCWTYNRAYVIGLLEKGYSPSDEMAKTILLNKGIIAGKSVMPTAAVSA